MARPVRELPRQRARRPLRVRQRRRHDPFAYRRRDAIPVPPRRGLLRHQAGLPVCGIPPIPGGEIRALDPELRQRVARREVRAFHAPDHFRLLGRGQPPASSSEPEPVGLFFSRRFSRTVSPSSGLSRVSSSRSPCTSNAVASRVVSPSRRCLPASRNSCAALRPSPEGSRSAQSQRL
jgi:hypothetical protein